MSIRATVHGDHEICADPTCREQLIAKNAARREVAGTQITTRNGEVNRDIGNRRFVSMLQVVGQHLTGTSIDVVLADPELGYAMLHMMADEYLSQDGAVPSDHAMLSPALEGATAIVLSDITGGSKRTMARRLGSEQELIYRMLGAIPPQKMFGIIEDLLRARSCVEFGVLNVSYSGQSPIEILVDGRSDQALRYGKTTPQLGSTGLSGATKKRAPSPSSKRPARNNIDLSAEPRKRTPVLRADEEVTLAKCIEAGLFAQERLAVGSMHDGSPIDEVLRSELMQIADEGKRAYEHMQIANLGLVFQWVMAYCRPDKTEQFNDLIQFGFIGLIRAVQKFDYSRGVKFSVYATWWIKQSITRSRNAERAIHLPIERYNEAISTYAAQLRLRELLQREPTIAEIAKRNGVSESVVEDALRNLNLVTISLNAPIGGDSGPITEFGNFVADSQANTERDALESVSIAECAQHIVHALGSLKPIQRSVIEMAYGLQGDPRKSDAEIAATLRLHPSTVRYHRIQALLQLREWWTQKGLPEPDSFFD